MKTDLSLIVSKSYSIFKYPRPVAITNVCTTCCLSSEDARKLLTLPLNEIPVELINEYNDGAQAIIYDMKEFKYFLPRYLDLIQNFEFTSVIDLSLSLKNLSFKNELFWKNKDEVTIIKQFSIAFFKKYLKEDLNKFEGNFADILNLFFTAQISIEPLLDIVKNNLTNKGISDIAELLVNGISFRKMRISSSFIDEELSTIIIKWITENKLLFYKYIEIYIMNKSNDDRSTQLSNMYDFLDYFR